MCVELGLFKRGYRTEKGGAPLKENMAALCDAYKLVSRQTILRPNLRFPKQP